MRAVVCISLLFLAGCATAGEMAEPSPDRTELTRPEIERVSHRNVLELVQAERPHWLRPRGRTSLLNEGELVVYVDGMRAGGASFLAQIHPIEIESIRYYDSREAQHRFGIGHTHGALNVFMRR